MSRNEWKTHLKLIIEPLAKISDTHVTTRFKLPEKKDEPPIYSAETKDMSLDYAEEAR